jgi:hypothetical protein
VRYQIEFEGIGRFSRPVFECQHKPLFTTGQICIGITESVQIGAAPERLAGFKLSIF